MERRFIFQQPQRTMAFAAGPGYLWDFGDGITDQGSSVVHSYTREGTFAVRVRAEGVDGIPAEKSSPLAVGGETRMSPPRRYEDGDE